MSNSSRLIPFLALSVLLLIPASATAQVVTHLQGTANAPLHSNLPTGKTFATGTKSKSQVDLPKGFFRVGSDTGVKVVTQNGLSLEKGIMLAGSNPAKFRRPEVNVNAPGYKLDVRGTVQIAYFPGSYVKIVVLEGKVRVALQSLAGEWETIEAGQMLIINPSDKRLPEPVEVDIGRLASTSQLIGGGFAELSTQGLIDSAASTQGTAYQNGDLAQTNLRLTGASPEVGLALPNRTPPASAARPNTVEQTIFRSTNDLAQPNAQVDSAPFQDGIAQASLGDVTIDRQGQQTQARAREWIVTMADGGQLYGSIDADPAMFTGENRKLTFRSTGGLEVLPTTNLTSPARVGIRLQGSGVKVEGANLNGGAGKTASEVIELASNGQEGISVTDSSLTAGRMDISTAAVAETGSSTPGTPLTLTRSKLEANQRLSIGKPTAKALITVSNSSELASLTAISIVTNGGSISVTDSTLTATTSLTLDAMGLGTGGEGLVEITNASLSASVIRARGYAVGGADSLVIDGSTLNASQMIRLYAEGVSTLRFRNHVSLTSPRVDLAGKTIIVDPGGQVSITGKGNVFTDDAQFNSANRPPVSGRGNLNATQGVSVSPYSNRPRF